MSKLNLFSQVQQQWVARYNYGFKSYDIAYSIAVDNYGNVYVTGGSPEFPWNYDFATIKYNESGILQWVARYNGPGNGIDEAYSIAVDGSGNVFVTGYSYGNGTFSDYATIKYNQLGVMQWIRRYNGPGNNMDQANALVLDNSGNVYVTGFSRTGSTSGTEDFVTIKYSPTGDLIWARMYNGPANSSDAARSIAADVLGNVYVTGSSKPTLNFGSDYATIKYNNSGDSVWVQRYNGPVNSDDTASSIVIDNSGNVYVTGYSWGGSSNFDYATIKYNSSGVQQWVQRYNGTGNNSDRAYSIAADGSGNVFVTGASYGSGISDSDYVTIKYSSSGVQQWVARYNGPGNRVDVAHSLKLDDAGNVYVTGHSFGNGSYYDYATIKYNSSGDQQWVQRYNGNISSNDFSFSITIDEPGNVYITGTSSSSGFELYDYATIKYSPVTGIHQINSEIPDRFSLSQNYPNPFNPATKIQFDIPLLRGVDGAGEDGLPAAGRGVLLVVYNILGSEVATLVNEKLKPGTYEVEWNASNYPSGVYYYRIITVDASTSLSTGFTETKKMILIR